MNTALNCIIKKRYSKWLFVTFLVLSFFTFSGFISQTQINPGKPQTTLVIRSFSRLVKNINYKRAVIPAQPKYLSLFSIVNADHLYTQLVKIRTKELKGTVLFPQTLLFYRTKSISQNTGDEPAILIG